MNEAHNKWYKIVSKTDSEVVILFLETQQKRKYGVLTSDQLEQMIRSESYVCLDNYYVKGFSYNKYCNHGYILKGFHAYNTFFDDGASFEEAIFGDGKVTFNCAVFGDGNVNFDNAKFGKGDVDFSGARFGYGDLSFESTEFGTGDIYFCNVSFPRGNVSFSETKLWKGNINFKSAQFRDGIVDFSYSELGEGGVYFGKTCFGKGKKDFSGLRKGEGETAFVNTDFGDGDVCFDSANFGNGRVLFIGSKFRNGPVGFFNTQFGGAVDFTKSHFKNCSVDFDYAVFGDMEIKFVGMNMSGCNLVFNNTTFGKGNLLIEGGSFEKSDIRFIDCILNSAVSLNKSKIYSLSFFNCTNHDLINFGWQSRCIIQKIAFFFHNNMGTILLNWDTYKFSVLNNNQFRFVDGEGAVVDGEGAIVDGKWVDRTDSLLSSEFKMLKENYHNQGEYRWEDETYVEYKRLETKQLPMINPKRWVLSMLYYVGKYGTDPLSVFATMIISVVIFAILFSTPCASIYPTNTLSHWWSPAYYSLITFLTIGYGDLSAQNGFTALLCGMEGFLGVFLMSYFSVAVVRKILR